MKTRSRNRFEWGLISLAQSDPMWPWNSSCDQRVPNFFATEAHFIMQLWQSWMFCQKRSFSLLQITVKSSSCLNSPKRQAFSFPQPNVTFNGERVWRLNFSSDVTSFSYFCEAAIFSFLQLIFLWKLFFINFNFRCFTKLPSYDS